MYYGTLEAIAAVGVAIAGFSGVVFVLGDRAGRPLTAEEKNGLFHLLYTSLGPVIISLVLHALLSSGVNEIGVWRAGCGITGIHTLYGASRALWETRGNTANWRGDLGQIAIVGAIVLGLANLVVAAGFFSDFASLGCLALLIYLLWVSMMNFASLLVPKFKE